MGEQWLPSASDQEDMQGPIVEGLQDTITQQAQEIERLQAMNGNLAQERIAFLLKSVGLEDQLAAMTAERDEAVERRELAYLQVHGLQAQLTASEQAAGRLRKLLDSVMGELKNIISANIKDWDDPTDTAFKLWAQSRARFTLDQAERALKGV